MKNDKIWWTLRLGTYRLKIISCDVTSMSLREMIAKTQGQNVDFTPQLICRFVVQDIISGNDHNRLDQVVWIATVPPIQSLTLIKQLVSAAYQRSNISDDDVVSGIEGEIIGRQIITSYDGFFRRFFSIEELIQ